MSLEETIREIVRDEFLKLQRSDNLVSLKDFCSQKRLSRVTIWRMEKQGKIKLTRMGTRIFINTNQFV